MSKQKKKRGSSTANPDAVKQALMHQKRFVERIETLCNALVGQGYFEKIPERILAQMYTSRYPALKIKANPGSDISKSTVVKANKLLNAFLEDQYITITNGERILLSLLLSEGLVLINFLHVVPANYFPNAALLKEEFKDYLPDSEGYLSLQEMLGIMVQDVNVFLSDLNKSVLTADISETACFNISSKHNDIYLDEFKTDKTSIVINDNSRSMFRLGWLVPDWEYPKVKPSALGFDVAGLDVPLDIYIQKHALDRMQERLDMVPGLMHYKTFLIFTEPEIKHYKDKNRSLVEFCLPDKKLGYLQVELHGNRLIIHTFLFLTNNGTPEGMKLEKLAGLQKADKMYLEIDKLSTFNSYHVDKNEQLKDLFIKAGCGSLLDLAHLQEFSVNEVKDKDPESILKYLADSKYFRSKETLEV
ncbi:hypothetical protein [Pedobacter foliorum]|uniref:hypothetical protein n=1 Tax=Pedobacter foliorum TaxID=2739058 RepID=UPI0015662538|nr:hypothetical protein [Pedobacter foliorum]NRF40713.1 hypothetical protein [Pedobacter foliorum]